MSAPVPPFSDSPPPRKPWCVFGIVKRPITPAKCASPPAKGHVVPGFRRLGLARTLLGVAEGWARDRGLGSIALHVSVWNDAARSLYESAGYGLVHEHEESRFYEKKL